MTKRPRLKIQDQLPLRTVGIETQRERDNFSDLPPQNYLHVWWSRKPTPASRLGILSSVLPSSVNNNQLLRWMGISPKNLPQNTDIDEYVRAKKKTEDDRDGFLYEHYGYRKSYKYTPSREELTDFHSQVKTAWDGELPTVLDATAGGGSIPFESIRYGLPTIANELNSVASVLLRAVLNHPRVNGDLSAEIENWGKEINKKVRDDLSEFFPNPGNSVKGLERIWARTVVCPDCGLTIPLGVNWWLDKKNPSEGIAAMPKVGNDNEVSFEIVELPNDVHKDDFNPSQGTISYGKAECLRCDVTIESDEIQSQAQKEGLGEQLYAIRVESTGNSNDGRHFVIPDQQEYRAIEKAKERVNESVELSTFLKEEIPSGNKTDEPRRYGMTEWRDFFSDRQLLTHHTYLQKFKEVETEIREEYEKATADAILTFLAIAADKSLTLNCRQSRWDPTTPKIAQIFESHDFGTRWAYAESNLIVEGFGYEWVLENTISAYADLREMSGESDAQSTVLQEDAGQLSLNHQSVDAVVLDPPYYDTIMYSELSDFFYVWMKKYLSDTHPEFFEDTLSNKLGSARL